MPQPEFGISLSQWTCLSEAVFLIPTLYSPAPPPRLPPPLKDVLLRHAAPSTLGHVDFSL